MCECKICGYIPPCSQCGHDPNEINEPTEEQLKEEALLDRMHKHEEKEGFRERYYKKMGWVFTPKSFVDE